MQAFLLIVAGCHGSHPTPAEPGTAGLAPPVPSTTTGSTTEPWVALPPSVRILGIPGLELGRHLVALPAHAGEPPLILVEPGGQLEREALGMPRTLVLRVPGALRNPRTITWTLWGSSS